MMPSMPAPVPTYARRGKELLVRRSMRLGPPSVALPDRCVKCGQPSTIKLNRTFYWHEPWVYVTILAGLLIYAILALVLRKQIFLGVPLCAQHRARRRNGILAAWGIFAAGLATPFVLGALDAGVAAGIGVTFLSMIVAAVVGTVVASPLRPTRIDELEATFKGCSEEFLRQLP